MNLNHDHQVVKNEIMSFCVEELHVVTQDHLNHGHQVVKNDFMIFCAQELQACSTVNSTTGEECNALDHCQWDFSGLGIQYQVPDQLCESGFDLFFDQVLAAKYKNMKYKK